MNHISDDEESEWLANIDPSLLDEFNDEKQVDDQEMSSFRAGSHKSQFCLLPIFGEEKIGKNFARAKFWRGSHWTNMFEPKLC